MKIPEVAEILGIGTSTLRRYMRRRLIGFVVLPGNDYRIRREDLKKFLDDRRIDPDEPKGPKDR